MTVEDFEKRQAAMSDKELIELAHKEISELCKTGGRSLRMCVPPMITDTDMVLCEVIKRFERLSNPINNDLHIPAVINSGCYLQPACWKHTFGSCNKEDCEGYTPKQPDL